MRLLVPFCLFVCQTVSAQVPTQSLRGTVTDAVTHQPLVGATLRAEGRDSSYLAVSDAYGEYVFARLPVGRYALDAAYVGYQQLHLPGVLIETGGATVVELMLERGLDLETVTVRADLPRLAPANTALIDIEQVQRFPATFYDPARLAASYAGVANTNDQANGLSIRGNSPVGTQWRLEGVEIVNPNHTPNAGTVSDRATLYGGGVNILSAQLLGDTRLYKGPFPARFGNVTGGVLDLQFRNADADAPRNAAQVSLLGFDVATERRLLPNSEAAVIANLRYSFTGLLAEAGVDFGGEEIRFTDAAFSTYLPVGNGGAYFKVFGVYGQSSNRFRGSDELESDDEPEKNRFDIDFESYTAIGGGSFVRPLGTASVWTTTLVSSSTESTRDQRGRVPGAFDESDALFQQKLAFYTGMRHQLTGRHQLREGLYATRFQFDARYRLLDGTQRTDGLPDATLFEGFVEWDYQWSNRWRSTLGLSAQYYTYGQNNRSLEPRITLAYRPGERHRITAAYGLHSQLPPPTLYVTALSGSETAVFPNIGFRRSHYGSLSYELFLPSTQQITLTGFYQHLFDVANWDGSVAAAYSAINTLEELPFGQFTNNGLGENYGLELTLQRRLQQNWYYLVNATYFRSRFGSTKGNGLVNSSRFDGRYLANATVGREWAAKRPGRFWGLNVRLNTFGGYRYRTVNAAASAAEGRTVFVGNERTLDLQVQDPRGYWRIDLRTYWKLNHPERTTTLALDIQNVTNTENFAFEYYDTVLDEVVEKTQLGLIPNLTYRVEW